MSGAEYWGEIDEPIPYLGEMDSPPVRDFGEIDAPPPPSPPVPMAPIRPVGAQLSQVGDPQTGGFQGTQPRDLGDIDVTDLGDIDVRQPVSQTFGDGPLYGPPAATGGYASSDYAKSHPAPKAHGGGGPSGPSAYDKATKAMRGTYDDDKGAIQRGVNAETNKNAFIVDGAEQIARQKRDDAMMQRLEAAQAAKTFSDYQAVTQGQIDDVRAKKINPNRAYADTGSAVAAVAGGVLGGIYQGLNKLEKNPFIEQMNKTMDRDIAAQETDLRTAKEGIGERKGLLAEMRATYKDEALAKLQARNLYIEAAKEELLSQASSYDSPAIQARADQAISALTREQTKLDINEAIRKAAAAQAAGAAAEHRRQQDFENRLKLQHSHNETTTANANAGKEAAEQGKNDVGRFVGTGQDENGPTGYLAKNVDDAKERSNARIAAEKLIKQIDRVQAIRREQGWTGRAASEAVHGAYDTEAANELAVLESDMTTTGAVAAHLGALSESDRGLMKAKYRDLNGVGSGADERLDELRRVLRGGLDAEIEQSAGAVARKYVGEDGREHVSLSGGSNAPLNQRTVPRRPVP